MKKYKKNKIRFNKKRILTTCAYGIISYAALFVRGLIPEKHPYYKQGAFVAALIFFILTLVSFSKLFDREVRTEIRHRIANLFMDFTARVGKVVKIIREKLGIPERVRLRGTDEVSYFKTDDRRKKQSTKPVRLKWKDMKTASDKIRFLYISYINKAVKAGYQYSSKRTPLETAEHMKAPEEAAALTGSYCRARYAQDFTATDEEIENMSEFVKYASYRR